MLVSSLDRSELSRLRRIARRPRAVARTSGGGIPQQSPVRGVGTVPDDLFSESTVPASGPAVGQCPHRTDHLAVDRPRGAGLVWCVAQPALAGFCLDVALTGSSSD